jgi:hypothetical protein
MQRLSCHWELFLNKSEYYSKIYQLLELIGLGCGYSVIVVDLVLQSRLRELFKLAEAGKFNEPSAIPPVTGMRMHQAISEAHTLLATEREVIGAYMFFTWTRVFAYAALFPPVYFCSILPLFPRCIFVTKCSGIWCICRGGDLICMP